MANINRTETYAKSEGPNGIHITVKQHLSDVAELAAQYASVFGMADAARAVGLLHDFGKYSDLFQDVLEGRAHGIDHALPGAYISQRFPHYISECVGAHHSNILSRGRLAPYLKEDCVQAPSGKLPAMQGRAQYLQASSAYKADFGDDILKKIQAMAGRDPDASDDHFARMMRTRMLLSCLVDADWTMSDAEEKGVDAPADKILTADSASQALRRLEDMREECSAKPCSEDTKRLRNTVWDDCGTAGQRGSPWMSLTAPTGAGKTFGFLRCALERCLADPSRQRVIIALPFLSLTDQVYHIACDIFHDVALNVSTAEVDDKNARDMAAKWDAPCVITTTVQLFGSLFSDRPGDVRKLHRLAGSVLILDEVQAIPDHVTQMAVHALEVLSRDYNTHVLLSTATQPSYELFKVRLHVPDEVIRDVGKLFAMAPSESIRVLDGDFDTNRLADLAMKYPDCCVISNLKRHAREIYDAWKAADLRRIKASSPRGEMNGNNGNDSLFLISTALCPAHRKDVVKAISRLQARGSPVHVSATQCIEAGVDLDFGQVIRAMAPLPSLIQAAGRQNRNRNRPRGEMLVVRMTQEGRKMLYPGSDYERLAHISRTLALKGYDLSDKTSLSEYDRIRFVKDPESGALSKAIRDEDYEAAAREARLIKSGGEQVVVPYDDSAYSDFLDDRPDWMALYSEFRDVVLSGRADKKLLHKVMPICVQSYDRDGIRAHCQEAVLYRHGTEIHTGIWVLLDEACYSMETGLQFEAAFLPM